MWLAARRSGAAQMAALPGMESLVPNVQAILLLDGDGRRIVRQVLSRSAAVGLGRFEAQAVQEDEERRRRSRRVRCHPDRQERGRSGAGPTLEPTSSARPTRTSSS